MNVINWCNVNNNWSLTSVLKHKYSIQKIIKVNDNTLLVLDNKMNFMLYNIKDDRLVTIEHSLGNINYISQLNCHSLEFVVITKENDVYKIFLNLKQEKIVIFESGNNYYVPKISNYLLFNIERFTDESFEVMREIETELTKEKVTSLYIGVDTSFIGTGKGDFYFYKKAKLFKFMKEKFIVKLIKLIDTDRYLLYDDHGFIYHVQFKNSNVKWNKVGTHIGGVYDFYYSKNYERVYSFGGNGFIYVFSLKDYSLIDAIPVNRGVISSYTRIGREFFVGTYDGNLVKVENENSFNPDYHFGSIWNMYYDQESNRVFTCGSDGQILELCAENGEIKNKYSGEMNWINSIGVLAEKNSIIGTDSKGNILEINNQKLLKHHVGDYWINNFSVNYDKRRIYLATADNKILITDFFFNIQEILNSHTDQVIDLEYSSLLQKLVSISVDGHICIWDTLNYQVNEITIKDLHFTSISLNEPNHYAIIGTFEGVLIKINLLNNKISKLNNCHGGRIWKVSTDSTTNRILTVCTENMLKVWDNHGNLNYKRKTNHLPTTCLISSRQIFWAESNGNVYSEKMIESPKLIEYNSFKEIKVNFNKKSESDDYQVFIYITEDSQKKLYEDRYTTLLDAINVDYKKIYLDTIDSKKKIIKKSGWNKFPQVFRGDTFIGAGSVFVEMARTETLQRILKIKSRRDKECQKM